MIAEEGNGVGAGGDEVEAEEAAAGAVTGQRRAGLARTHGLVAGPVRHPMMALAGARKAQAMMCQ